ncbi:MAG: hypothetical protein IIZ25_00850 [Thermoguttaceae bacterium]|nr:hypothetical protein [Thermoguttaceae bacterium]
MGPALKNLGDLLIKPVDLFEETLVGSLDSIKELLCLGGHFDVPYW